MLPDAVEGITSPHGEEEPGQTHKRGTVLLGRKSALGAFTVLIKLNTILRLAQLAAIAKADDIGVPWTQKPALREEEDRPLFH